MSLNSDKIGTYMLEILECSPIAQFSLGLDHNITFWNKACELLTGYASSEMIGTRNQWQPFYPEKRPVLSDLIIEQDSQKILSLYSKNSVARSLIVENAWEATSYFKNLGGRSRYVYFLAAPLKDENGDFVGAIETLQDVTELQKDISKVKEESRRIQQVNQKLISVLHRQDRFDGIVGKSQVMKEVYDLIIKAAAKDTNVIISGESGTGKELVARAIHKIGKRSDNRFVEVNCGAVPENLFESEFFGYTKGAFTGADDNKKGYLGLAEGGTLFLDEVGEISPTMQVKLLRAIEGGGYAPIGTSETIVPDIRIIAATNRNLMELVHSGKMRQDFYFRIHVIPIHLPRLKERSGDLRLLVDHFLNEFGFTSSMTSLPKELRQMLKSYDWPGNVRELQNILYRFVTLNKIDFPTSSRAELKGDELTQLDESSKEPLQLRHEMDNFEKHLILKALKRTRWHRNKSAIVLGVTRNTLFRKMKKYGLL